MCDTILAPPSATAGHAMLFGKNSDRYRNEAQVVEYRPAAEHAADEQLRCTYIRIPQARRTHAVLLCRPFWIWGAEMGANEHGVVVGNEGLLAKGPAPVENALVGMDLLRLALERAASAEEAVEVVTSLLQKYGQGGNCGHLKNNYYHNSFMIADARAAFVVETVGREWFLETVRDVRAISNCYSIGQHPDRVSGGLAKMVRDAGWSSDALPSYAHAIADPKAQHVGDAAGRMARSMALMQADAGRLHAGSMMRVLRDHGTRDVDVNNWHPQHERCRTLCVHAGADSAPAQTTGSLVSEIRPGSAVHWVTATSAPCISIFKPVLMDLPLPDQGPSPTDQFDSRTLWWRHERLHRALMLSEEFAKFLADITPERDALEASFRDRINAVAIGGSFEDRSYVVEQCWQEALQLETAWLTRITLPAPAAEKSPFSSGWNTMNALAGIDPLKR